MEYRLAKPEDLLQMMEMVDQAKASFRERGIDQWQKGEPDAPGLSSAIAAGQVRVLELSGRVVAMITLMEGPDPSYREIDGSWLNDRPYMAFHRVCVAEDLKGRGLAAKLCAASEEESGRRGYRDIRIDTHPDNRSMQRALEKSGYLRCGTLRLLGGSEDGDLRVGFQKVLRPEGVRAEI